MKQLVIFFAEILVVVTFLMQFFYVYDSYHVVETLMAVFLVICLHRCGFKFTFVDICVLLLWIYMLLSPTINSYLSLQCLWRFTSSCLFYFLVRCLFLYGDGFRLMVVITSCIFILLLLACAMFVIFLNAIWNLDFESWYDFRFLYAPLGIPNNEWSSILWLFGGIVAATYFYVSHRLIRWLAIISGGMVLFLMMISFSRGIYLSIVIVAFLFLVLISKRFQKRSVCIFVGYCMLIAAGIYGLFPKEVSKIIQFNDTVSQQRSTENRWNAIRLTDDILNEYPWGVGAGNYVVAKDYYLTGASRPDTYTSYAPNTLIKACVEGGYVGGVLYLLLWVISLFSLIKRKDYRCCFIALFMLGYFLRELTFSTFFDSTRVQMAIFFLMVLIQKKDYALSVSSVPFVVKLLPGVCYISVLLYSLYGYLSPVQAKNKNTLDVQQMFRCAVARSDELCLQSLVNNYPDKVYLRWMLYEWHWKQNKIALAADDLTCCILQNPPILSTNYWQELHRREPTFTQQVENLLSKRIITCSNDPITQAKYGSIALYLGYDGIAEELLQSAVKQLPSLSRAWLNLSDISLQHRNIHAYTLYRKRAQIIECGVFGDYEHYVPQKEIDINVLLYRNESIRSHIWYGEGL